MPKALVALVALFVALGAGYGLSRLPQASVQTTAEEANFDTPAAAAETGPQKIEAHIGQAVTIRGVTLTPQRVLEDSRCPVDVQCIQAGTVILEAALQSNSSSAPQEFKLGEAVTVESEIITLAEVRPGRSSAASIGEAEYVFVFSAEPQSVETLH